MMNFRFTLLAGLLLVGHAVYAETSTETVTVIGSRLSNAEQAAGVTVLTPEDWASLPVSDLAGVLGRQAGINLRSLFGNGAETSIDLRGFGATANQNTLFLLNGRRLNDLDLSTIDLAAIPLNRVTRIEVMRGAGSVIYGDGSSAGVINIITENTDSKGSSGTLAAHAGSNSNYGVSANGLFASDTTRLALSGSDLQHGGYRDNNELKERSGSAELQLDSGSDRWLFRLDGDDQELQYPGVRRVNALQNQLRDDPEGSSTPNDHGKKQATNASVAYESDINKELQVIVDTTLRTKNQQAFFDDYSGDGFSNFVDSDLRQLSLTPRLAWRNEEGRHDQGLDLSRSDYDSLRSQLASSAPIHTLSAQRDSAAIYSQSYFAMHAGSELSFGLRWQGVELTANDGFNATAPGAGFESGAAPLSQREHATTGQLGWEEQFSDSWSAYFQVARSVRFPTVDEVFQFNSSFAREFSTLESQMSDGLDLGLEFKGQSTAFSARAFHQRLKNEIHFNPVDFRNTNLDPTRRSGLELSAHWQVVDSFALRANATGLRAQFREGPFKDKDIPLVPERSGLLGFDWQFANDWQLAADGRYQSEQRLDNDESNSFAEQIPARTLIDASLGWKNSHWAATLQVNNLTDEAYFDYGVRSTFSNNYNVYPLAGREARVNLAYTF